MNDVLDQLRRIRTPIIYDAVEKFGVRPRTEGYSDSSIKCLFPSMGPLIGYACTGKVMAEIPPVDGEKCAPWRDVWEYANRSRTPSVMVVQDLDQPSGKGCAWGDVAASIFLAMGCVGAITNGGVRDIDEVEKLGFHLFAPSPVVGHAYIRFVEIDTPVKIGGLVVNPGDLIHADKHGVVTIPKEIDLEELVRFAGKFLDSESSVISYAQSPGFTVDGVCKAMDEHDSKMGGHFGKG
jgi:4-hydroxy-4-methyl-2-oxoglutarate aldolase